MENSYCTVFRWRFIFFPDGSLQNFLALISYHTTQVIFWTLLSAPAVLVVLLLTTDLNSLHSSIIAMTLGGMATWYYRPDLKKKMIVSAFLFLALYFVYFWTLIVIASVGYVENVWNLEGLSGILIMGIPLEELLFALSFGFIWSSIYEHLAWKKLKLIKQI